MSSEPSDPRPAPAPASPPEAQPAPRPEYRPEYGPDYARAALVAVEKPYFEHPMVARFQDVDAAGIVFFARFFDYFHDAYVGFLSHYGASLHTALVTGEWSAPLKHAEAEYLRPVRFGDAIVVAIVRARFDGSDLRVAYRITGADGRPAAIGRSHHVFVDHATFRRQPPPPLLVSRLLAHPCT